MSSGEGQKVTTDPERFNEPKNENPGMVTSDSLAAESIREGGSFAANADSRGPMGVPSHATTANTTDVSNATRLEPAADAEARAANEAWGETAQLNAGQRLGKGRGDAPTTDDDPVARADGQGAAAPGYIASQYAAGGDPKGDDLREGGFDPDAPNASFSTRIGTKHDPGRAALSGLQQDNVPFAGGAGPRDTQVSNDGQFDSLGDASA